jgi:hypothetical protein
VLCDVISAMTEFMARVLHSRLLLDPTSARVHCSLVASMRVTNGISLRSPLLLPVDAVNDVATLKARFALQHPPARP